MKCKPIQDACQAYIQTNGFLRGMSQAAIGVIFAYPLFALLNSVAGTVVFAYFEAPAFYFFILSAGLLFASGNFIMLMAGLGAQAVVSLVAFIMAIVTSARWGGFGFSIVSALLELAVMGLLTLLSYKAYTFGRPSARPAAYMCRCRPWSKPARRGRRQDSPLPILRTAHPPGRTTTRHTRPRR